jgi:predicted nucleotidyltransferase
MHREIADRRAALAELCRQFDVTRLEVFGSAARGDDFDLAHSDADFLVNFAPGTDAADRLSRFFGFQTALEVLLGRPVDLVERPALATSRNYLRRRAILADAELVYGT